MAANLAGSDPSVTKHVLWESLGHTVDIPVTAKMMPVATQMALASRLVCLDGLDAAALFRVKRAGGGWSADNPVGGVHLPATPRLVSARASVLSPRTDQAVRQSVKPNGACL